jgi:hypothetical protein
MHLHHTYVRWCVGEVVIPHTRIMMTKEVIALATISDARLEYELVFGRCTDNHWRNIQKTLKKNQMEVTPQNVRFLAEIRKVIPRCAIGVDGVLTCYAKAEKLLNTANQNMKGSEVLNILSQHGVKPHQSTVTRWFKPLGGYRKDKEYSPQELKTIFTNAFIYKAIHAQTLEELSS